MSIIRVNGVVRTKGTSEIVGSVDQLVYSDGYTIPEGKTFVDVLAEEGLEFTNHPDVEGEITNLTEVYSPLQTQDMLFAEQHAQLNKLQDVTTKFENHALHCITTIGTIVPVNAGRNKEATETEAKISMDVALNGGFNCLDDTLLVTGLLVGIRNVIDQRAEVISNQYPDYDKSLAEEATKAVDALEKALGNLIDTDGYVVKFTGAKNVFTKEEMDQHVEEFNSKMMHHAFDEIAETMFNIKRDQPHNIQEGSFQEVTEDAPVLGESVAEAITGDVDTEAMLNDIEEETVTPSVSAELTSVTEVEQANVAPKEVVMDSVETIEQSEQEAKEQRIAEAKEAQRDFLNTK